MADVSYVESQLRAFDGPQRVSLKNIFLHVLKANLRIGVDRPQNLALYGVEGRTHATPDTAFDVEHGLGKTPRLLIPCVDLNTANQELVPLKVVSANERFIRLSSSVGDAPFRVLLEG